MCDYQYYIIANSSFSALAAYLSEHENKVIIYPNLGGEIQKSIREYTKKLDISRKSQYLGIIKFVFKKI